MWPQALDTMYIYIYPDSWFNCAATDLIVNTIPYKEKLPKYSLLISRLRVFEISNTIYFVLSEMQQH